MDLCLEFYNYEAVLKSPLLSTLFPSCKNSSSFSIHLKFDIQKNAGLLLRDRRFIARKNHILSSETVKLYLPHDSRTYRPQSFT